MAFPGAGVAPRGSRRVLPGACIAVAVVLTAGPGQAQRLPAPATYLAPRAETPVVVDGLADEAAWQAVPWSDPFVDIRGPAFPQPSLETRVKLLWDDQHLYVAAILHEPHLWATLLERDAIIYRDDDFEVFVDPDGDGLDYYELEINAYGTEFDLFLNRPYSEGGEAHIPWDMPGLRTSVFLHGSLNDPSDIDDGWSVEMAIPWEDLVPPGWDPASAPEGGRTGRAPEVDDVWRVNFSRVEWPLRVENGRYVKAAEPVDWSDHPEDNWVWSPQWEINMHIPSRWGFVWFVDGMW